MQKLKYGESSVKAHGARFLEYASVLLVRRVSFKRECGHRQCLPPQAAMNPTLLLLIHLLVTLQYSKSEGSSTPMHYLAQALPEGLILTRHIQNTTITEHKIQLNNQVCFKVYHPALFQILRRNAGVSEDDYINALCLESLICFSSDSKSGATFWVSSNAKIVLKTIKHYECKNLNNILHYYAEHVCNEKSCISAILGVYRVQYKRNTKYFLACVNIYPNDEAFILNKYDLKGSTVGRSAIATSVVKKDLNLIASGALLQLGPSRDVILRALERDARFLSAHGFMDYSCLVAEEKHSAGSVARFGRTSNGALAVSSQLTSER